MELTTGSKQFVLGDAASILESITDAFYGLNRDWEFTYLNRQAQQLLARTAADLLGKNVWEKYPSAVGSEIEAMFRRAVTENVTVSFTTYYADHDRWYEVHAYPSADGLSVYFRNASERIKAEQRLRDSETRFRLMADAIPQIVWITDAVGNAEFFNQKWTDYTGTPYNPATAEDISSRFVHPDDHLPTMRAWGEAQRQGTTFTIEHRIRSAAGEYRWFLVRAQPYRDPQTGEVVRWFGTSTDVHDNKLMEEARLRSEAKYRTLFNSIDEGFCIVEMIFDAAGKPADYRFLEVNDLFEQQTGLSDVIEKTVSEVIPNNETRWFEIYGRVAQTGEPVRFEDESKALNRWYDVYAFRADATANNLVAILFKDVTERKRHEHEMVKADRNKDEFLAMLAHELRNPLAPISAAADLLRLARLDESRVRQTSEVIARQVKHMTSLVDDLLDVSRVTRGLVKLEMNVLDAKRIIADAAEQVRPLMESRRHHLAVFLPPDTTFVYGDAKRLVQVAANMLNNAAKYTPEGGSIDMRVDVRAEHVLIEVKDNGIGMTPDLQGCVFDMFTQGTRTADRSQGGLGIGLSLVKSLVELHRGVVTAQSAGLGKGSVFSVYLPRVSAAEAFQGAAGGGPQGGPLGRLKLMLVEDNNDAAAMLAMFLNAAGHDVIVEHDSRRALERSRHEQPDVFLLDIGLPDMDGNDLARRLRGQPETVGATLIAVTGYGQESDRRATAEAGFNHHFVKPVDTAMLSALLSELAAARSGRRKTDITS
ncbi:hybrid sensor histidine kinase/response regulator [Noviherbaspirillum galbum]|uniref:histidine kinase n=1 Tax=Noviherbaspirillum galbum TaxID=2709383 RepID=A0A6B3SN75_9BURK|nr:PAS domain S-box protein [Noviherbaspirillum galbum]NEX62137.1 PAS domain S-box protein [Noviherbaspirillum galbum]